MSRALAEPGAVAFAPTVRPAQPRPGLGLHVVTAVAGLLIINLVAVTLRGIPTVLAAAALVVAAIASLRRWRLLLGTVTFLVSMALLFWAPVLRHGAWSLLSMTGFWMLRFGAAVMAAVYVLLTVTSGDFLAALHRFRAPRLLSVPVTVMLRFLPQGHAEFRAIGEAMTMRGIPTGFRSWLLHPMRTLEYLIVPLLVSSSRIADDLTASGLVWGLGGPHNPTPLRETPFTWRDAVAAAVLVALVAAALWPGWMI